MHLPQRNSHRCGINRGVSGLVLMVMHSYAFIGKEDPHWGAAVECRHEVRFHL